MQINQATIDLVKKWADVTGENDCWIFHKKNRVKNGTGRLEYGQVTYLKKKWRAHRLVALTHFGNIPDGMQVCHKCDNPLCLNPAHLFFGTNAENVKDKMQKGRHKAARGEASGNSKITKKQAAEIRKLALSGMRQAEIAEMYGVSRSNVSIIKSGGTWANADQ
jgi:predicted XRE-type DNA-binding protein